MVAKWEEVEGMGEKAKGIKKYKLVVIQSSTGDVKYSIGNGVAKEYVCVTHGHGQQDGNCLRELGGGRVERGKIGTTVRA